MSHCAFVGSVAEQVPGRTEDLRGGNTQGAAWRKARLREQVQPERAGSAVGATRGKASSDNQGVAGTASQGAEASTVLDWSDSVMVGACVLHWCMRDECEQF
eukprot:15109703-Alexandrium_andersonii.AAC.1